MRADSLPFFQLFAPTIFVIGAIYLLGSLLPMARSWARCFIFAVVWSVIAWYLHWRLTVTILPAKGESVRGRLGLVVLCR